MFLKSLRISDMRCFRYAEAEFQHPGREVQTPVEYPNINVLLGNNGMGKSATLMAAALAVLAPIIEAAGYVPYSIVRRDRRKEPPTTEIRGELLLHRQDVENTDHASGDTVEVLTVVKRTRTTERIVQRQQAEDPLWENMFDDRSPAFLLVGYGASRTVESSETLDISARRKSRLMRRLNVTRAKSSG